MPELPTSPTSYDKPFLSIEEQLELLAQRGMHIPDRDEATHYLRHEGYYRLSTYFIPFRQRSPKGESLDNFYEGTSFSDVVKIYDFDKQLRLYMLPALRAIEISVRVAVAHHLGRKNIFAHETPACLNNLFVTRESTRRGKTWHQVWLDKYHALLARDDQERIVRQFIAKYGQKIPIWVAIEIWDFGLLSRFFAGMKFPDQQTVSRTYGVDDPNLFASWLRNFNAVRNVCAHHSRLWNRNIVDQPRLISKHPISLLKHLTERGVKSPGARVYATLALTNYLLREMKYRTPWRESIIALLKEFPSSQHISPEMMGLPQNWSQLPLWQP
jgi:abortive infection bacteriophage resistance protein